MTALRCRESIPDRPRLRRLSGPSLATPSLTIRSLTIRSLTIRSLTVLLFASLLMASTPGCVADPGHQPPPGTLNADQFRVIQPVLERGCANPTCHGNAERPWRIYARHMHRADAAATWSDAPLTDAELTANATWTMPFIKHADPDGSELVRKPLHPSAGGSPHVGGAQYRDRDDPDFAALRAWVADCVELVR